MMTTDLTHEFICSKCGKHHLFGMYVFAHWNDELSHSCECGAMHIIQRGEARRNIEAERDADSIPNR